MVSRAGNAREKRAMSYSASRRSKLMTSDRLSCMIPHMYRQGVIGYNEDLEDHTLSALFHDFSVVSISTRFRRHEIGV